MNCVLQGVIGYMVFSRDGVPIRSTCDVRPNFPALPGLQRQASTMSVGWSLPQKTAFAHAQAATTAIHAAVIPQLATVAKAMVRDLDPQVMRCQLRYVTVSISSAPERIPKRNHAPPMWLMNRRTTWSFCGSGPSSTSSWWHQVSSRQFVHLLHSRSHAFPY